MCVSCISIYKLAKGINNGKRIKRLKYVCCCWTSWFPCISTESVTPSICFAEQPSVAQVANELLGRCGDDLHLVRIGKLKGCANVLIGIFELHIRLLDLHQNLSFTCHCKNLWPLCRASPFSTSILGLGAPILARLHLNPAQVRKATRQERGGSGHCPYPHIHQPRCNVPVLFKGLSSARKKVCFGPNLWFTPSDRPFLQPRCRHNFHQTPRPLEDARGEQDHLGEGDVSRPNQDDKVHHASPVSAWSNQVEQVQNMSTDASHAHSPSWPGDQVATGQDMVSQLGQVFQVFLRSHHPRQRTSQNINQY